MTSPPSLTLRNHHDMIRSRDTHIAVVGLGYVGLPVACEFARVGFLVTGVDIQPDRVARISAGDNPIEGNEPGLSALLADVILSGRLKVATDYEAIRDADVVTINVDTPVNKSHAPEYMALRTACMSLGKVLKPGALVIVESTVAPGTTSTLVHEWISEASQSKSFFLGACPERVMPGRLLHNLRTVPRVCGGETPEVAELMRELYLQVVNAEVDTTDILTAELVKTTENAYRDVNIAFANEVALICEQVGGDVYAVRELVNKSPGRSMLMPGAGVGGHCIPKDPWLLASAVADRLDLRLIPAARAINSSMPIHVGRMVLQMLAEMASEAPYRVLVLGMSYRENCADVRQTPSEVLVSMLQSEAVDVVAHDPWVDGVNGDVYELARNADVVAIMVAHDAYLELDLSRLKCQMRNASIVDGRGIMSRSSAETAGYNYARIGIAQSHMRKDQAGTL